MQTIKKTTTVKTSKSVVPPVNRRSIAAYKAVQTRKLNAGRL
jgi:hypothetical protein